MFFPLLTIIKFPFEIISGVIAGLICKAYFSSQLKNKLREYEKNIKKNDERIAELEDLNNKLEKQLKDQERHFLKGSINMN